MPSSAASMRRRNWARTFRSLSAWKLSWGIWPRFWSKSLRPVPRRRLPNGSSGLSTHAAPQTGPASEDHSDQKPDAVNDICHVGNDSQDAHHEPADHPHDGIMRYDNPERRFVTAFHPEITEQAVNDAGHAAECRTAPP